jgi:hypothetical protein
LLQSAEAENGKCRDKRDDPSARKASRRSHHVLLGDPELKEALGVALTKMMHAGASGNVGIEHHKIWVPGGQLDQGLAECLAK